MSHYTLDQMIMALIRAESREAVRAYQAGIPPNKADTKILRAIEDHIKRAAEIDAKFTEREKTVRMGRDPACEAEREVMVDRLIAQYRKEQSSANPNAGMSRPFAHRLVAAMLNGDAK